MFVRNPSRFDARLARGYLFDELAVAAMVVPSSWRITDAGLAPLIEPPPTQASDPPDVSRLVLWEGVSVTVAGSATGPAQPPYVAPVLLRIGEAVRRLIVFGERRWERRWGGGLEASPPAAFERITLSFERAFGGGFDVAPGLLPGTDLPHPAFRMKYPLNEHGVGYYPDESTALGARLPNIEWPHQLVKHWNDAPEPAGFSPCPDLMALRAWADQSAAGRIPADLAKAQASSQRTPPSLRILHYSPPSLIFDELPPGMPIELQGLGRGPLRFVVPAAAARVSVPRRRADEMQIKPRLRGLHIDADEGLVRLVHDYTFTYHPRRPPSWIHVGALEAS